MIGTSVCTPGHAGRALRIGLGLFLQRMRRMIGAENIDDALRHAVPDVIAMARAAHRRIHLQPRAEPRIIVGTQSQMMRRDFDTRYVFVLCEKIDLLRRRDMQHMDLRAGRARDAHQTLRAQKRRVFVAPDRMRGRIALDADARALLQAIFVLGMEGGAPPRLAENRRNPGIVLDQQDCRSTSP